MKKFLTVMAALTMVGGCVTMQNFFCKPTAGQQHHAQIYLTYI